MVSHLVGDDISLREIAGRLEGPLQFVIKPEVDVNRFVARAIEGPHSGVAHAATGRVSVPVDHEFRHGVRVPDAPEFLLPDVFCVGQHYRYEFEQPFFFGRGLVTHLPDLAAAKDGRRIEQADLPADDAESGQHEDALQAESPADEIEQGGESGRTRGHPLAAGIRHVGTASAPLPLHALLITTRQRLRQLQPRNS